MKMTVTKCDRRKSPRNVMLQIDTVYQCECAAQAIGTMGETCHCRALVCQECRAYIRLSASKRRTSKTASSQPDAGFCIPTKVLRQPLKPCRQQFCHQRLC